MMKRSAVASSVLASLAYDEDSMTLEIEFKNGAVYQYSGVDSEVFALLAAATSKGQYFDEAIKTKYPCRRVR